MVFQFNGVLLQSTITGNLAPTSVPGGLYAKPDSFKSCVIAHNGVQTEPCNEVVFMVQ